MTRYPLVADIIRQRILDEQHDPAGKLGTYLELTSQLGVSKNVVANALRILLAEGAVEVDTTGIYVSPRPKVRYCSICGRFKSRDNFAGSAGKKSKCQAYCIPCQRLDSQLRFHNMSHDDYRAMLTAQDGKCAICHEIMERVEIDHDHACCDGRSRTCGRCNRELLCSDCNRMIGWSRDNADRLMAGAAYVLQWKGVVSGAVA